MARIVESVVQERALAVADGVIAGAKLIGNISVNGRRYSDDVIAEAIARYNGAKVYLNHPATRDGAGDRDFNDWVGVIENATPRIGGGWGDIRLRKEHSRFKEICEAVEHFPKHFGLSHVADIDSRFEGATEHVTRIGEVFSVDIVTDPATTKGIRESRNQTMKKLTNKQILEGTKASKSPLRRVLEMVDAALPDAPPVEVEVEQPNDEAIKAGIMAAITEKLSAASADQLKKVLKALEIGDSVSALVAGEGGDAPAEPPAEPAAAAEARELRQRLAVMEAKGLLLESGREATEIRIKAVAAASESDKKALVESFPAKEAAAPRSFGRPHASPPASGNGDSKASTFESDNSAWQRRLKAARESARV